MRAFLDSLFFTFTNFVLKRAIKKYLVLESSEIHTLPPARKSKPYLLYIHIPFCHTLCVYCSFNRFLFNEQKARKYFQSLRREIALIHQLGYDFDSIYVGGGTTSIMLDELLATLHYAKELFPNITHISCESDPNHISPQELQSLKGIVDRLSIGVQSFDDGILAKIGRLEKFGDGASLQARLKHTKNTLPIINVDLIFNFPNQTQAMLMRDIEIVKSLNPTQITFYPLMSSTLTHSLITRTLGKASHDQEQTFYHLITQAMSDEYEQVSAWAFSKKQDDVFDEYIVQNDEYIGVGSGSFSFLDGTLYVNTFSLKKYSQCLEQGGDIPQQGAIERKKHFSFKSQMQYRLMVGLFGGKIHLPSFNAHFHTNLSRVCFFEILFLRFWGMVKKQGAYLITTPKGRYLFLRLQKEFYIGMDNIREQSRATLNDEDM
ncbi:MAG TPA: coproporphyrinogen III oxidase family protein [Candidatus Helicobacter avicola]|nr:coproporphyrinogen III oxidase family protein [Candidatus Helicobacter avicola]